MRWEYCVSIMEHVSRIVREYDEKLRSLEQRSRDRQVRQRIRKEKEQLRRTFAETCSGDLRLALSSQFVDSVTVWWFSRDLPRRDDARCEVYVPVVKGLTIQDPWKVCEEIDFRPNFSRLLSSSWLGLEVDFELLTPWYSKDDRVFHVLDNPVRKDRVFGVPFMAASSWKGMLRWAFLLVNKLIGPEQEKDEAKREKAKAMELHLFGNEKGEEENLHQGALVFYPTWFNKIGFEVINPHSRERRAGTKPIYYEVVPGRRPKQTNPSASKDGEKVEKVAGQGEGLRKDHATDFEEGGKGTLSLLYAPWPGMKPEANLAEALPKLLEAIDTLVTTTGISAKRTVGWGTAEILEWRVYRKGKEPQQATREEWEKEAPENRKAFWRFFWEHKVSPLLKEGCAQ